MYVVYSNSLYCLSIFCLLTLKIFFSQKHYSLVSTFLAITLTFTCNFQYLLIGKLFKLYSVMSVFDLCFAYTCTSIRAH